MGEEWDYARPPMQQETRERLREAKRGGESFDEVVNRILDEREGRDRDD